MTEAEIESGATRILAPNEAPRIFQGIEPEDPGVFKGIVPEPKPAVEPPAPVPEAPAPDPPKMWSTAVVAKIQAAARKVFTEWNTASEDVVAAMETMAIVDDAKIVMIVVKREELKRAMAPFYNMTGAPKPVKMALSDTTKVVDDFATSTYNSRYMARIFGIIDVLPDYDGKPRTGKKSTDIGAVLRMGMEYMIEIDVPDIVTFYLAPRIEND